MKLLPSNTD